MRRALRFYAFHTHAPAHSRAGFWRHPRDRSIEHTGYLESAARGMSPAAAQICPGDAQRADGGRLTAAGRLGLRDLLIAWRPVGQCRTLLHVVARAAHRAAEQQPLAFVVNVDIRQSPFRAAGLIDASKHDEYKKTSETASYSNRTPHRRENKRNRFQQARCSALDGSLSTLKKQATCRP